ncbi:MAG: hypothetical protein K0R93_1212 [Anaerosolibacter sp.]|jgi:hypothetical protein|nr:hypothetical protein [Anaerosolibacter sp.]
MMKVFRFNIKVLVIRFGTFLHMLTARHHSCGVRRENRAGLEGIIV